LSSKSISDVSIENKGLATTDDFSCTNGCTSDGKSERVDPVATLAAVLLALSPEDRARLGALLGQKGRA
jgi:hypothetical protein